MKTTRQKDRKNDLTIKLNKTNLKNLFNSKKMNNFNNYSPKKQCLAFSNFQRS